MQCYSHCETGSHRCLQTDLSWLSSFIPTFTQENENFRIHKVLYQNAHSNWIHTRQKLEYFRPRENGKTNNCGAFTLLSRPKDQILTTGNDVKEPKAFQGVGAAFHRGAPCMGSSGTAQTNLKQESPLQVGEEGKVWDGLNPEVPLGLSSELLSPLSTPKGLYGSLPMLSICSRCSVLFHG